MSGKISEIASISMFVFNPISGLGDLALFPFVLVCMRLLRPHTRILPLSNLRTIDKAKGF